MVKFMYVHVFIFLNLILYIDIILIYYIHLYFMSFLFIQYTFYFIILNFIILNFIILNFVSLLLFDCYYLIFIIYFYINNLIKKKITYHKLMIDIIFILLLYQIHI